VARQVPWLRILAEGFAIVVSILLAFGIQAWWEGRQERAEEQEILAGLRSDFTAIERGLINARRVVVRRQERLQWLLSLPDASLANVPVIQADSAFFAFIATGTYEPSEATLDGLVSSGKMDLLQSRELRTKLTAWRRTLDEVQDGEAVMRTLDHEQIVPYLARQGVPLRAGYPDQLVSDIEVAEIYARAIQQPEFRTLASYKLGWLSATVGEYDEALVAVRDILAVLDRELDRS